MKIFAWLVLGFIVLIIFALLYYLLVGELLFHIVFSRKSLSSRVLRKNIEKKLEEYKIDLCWWNKHKFVKFTTKSFDQLKLVGHYFESNSNNTVIVVHGFGQDYREMQQYCKFFLEKNFNILVVDNRTHGESQGNCIGFGWLDRKDILSWINFLNEKTPNRNILLFGISMGAAAVCCASGEKLPDNVVAVISDSAYCNVDKQIDYVMKKMNFLRKPIKKHLYSYTKRVHGFNVLEADVVKQVKNTKIPIFYVHGEQDDFVPVENLYSLYNSTPENLREKFVVEDAKHVMSYPISGILYEKKISDFLKSRTTIFRT